MRIAHYSIPRQPSASHKGAIGVGRMQRMQSGTQFLPFATFPGGEAHA